MGTRLGGIMRRKKFGSLILTVCLTLGLLSGCENTSSVENESTEEKQTVLRFFHYQGEAEAAYNKVFDAYEEAHPNVKIVSEFLNSASYASTLEARIATKDYPDIIGVHPGSIQVLPLAEAGYLEDLTGQRCLLDISEGNLKTASLEAGIYGVPTDQSYICTFYNKDMFEKYQLSVPQTWEEFLNVCQRLKEEGITPISMGYKDIWLESLIPYALVPTTIYRSNMNFDDDLYAQRKHFNGKEWNETLGKLKELMDRGYVTENFMKTSYDQQLAAFANGQAAMMIMGTWGVAMVQNLNESCNFGLFITPGSDDGVNWISSSVGGMLSVCKDSKQKDTAVDFLNFFLGTDEVYCRFLEDTGNLSARMNFSADCEPELQMLIKDIPGSYFFLDEKWPRSFQNEFLKMIGEVGIGANISEALGHLDDAWEKEVLDK